jgi:hypothetical protein
VLWEGRRFRGIGDESLLGSSLAVIEVSEVSEGVERDITQCRVVKVIQEVAGEIIQYLVDEETAT